MIDTKVCRKCGVVLDSENWYSSSKIKGVYICRECTKEQGIRANRKQGMRPFNENRKCALFLGVHVAEHVLSKVFKDVERMPMCNPGYDFICNKGKKIDVKSSCIRRNGSWRFNIKRNTIADFFLCLAFDNREDLTPLHVWLLPGEKFNHLTITAIRQSTSHKWDEYRLDLTKVSTCCDAMR